MIKQEDDADNSDDSAQYNTGLVVAFSLHFQICLFIVGGALYPMFVVFIHLFYFT